MLQTKICNISLKNPTILASGILGVTKESVGRIGKNGAGAVTLKSLCHEERAGFLNPTMFGYDGVFLNAVGLPGQGIDSAIKDFKRLDDLGVPVIGSIYGYRVEQFGQVAKKMGGVTGPALKPIAVRCVYEIYETVKIPIIGTGGVTYGKDAIEMVMAGATAVGIGTGIYYRGNDIFRKVCDEMEAWMKKNKVRTLDEIRGCAHK